MAKILPYFKWFPADAESDEKYAAMTIAERGLYHSALNYSWINDGLPTDASEVSRVLRVPSRDFMKAWPRVALCFSGHERLRNQRQESERADAFRLSDARAKSGQQGGKRKAIAKQLPEVCLSKGSVRAYESESESESKKENQELDWAERVCDRHPKITYRALSLSCLQDLLGSLNFDRDAFDRVHIAWCATDGWKEKNGQFAPKLSDWIVDRGYLKPPYVAAASEQPKECPHCRRSLQNCNCVEIAYNREKEQRSGKIPPIARTA